MSLLDTASLIVTPNGYKEGKLYSVIPSDGSGDLSVVRATTATRVNSAGLVELVPYNLNTNSENFTTSWGNDGTSTTTNNFTTAPNGTMTAAKTVANVANGYAYKSLPVPSGTYTLSYYVKASAPTTMSIAFNDVGGNGYIGSYGIAVTTEWQRISLTANLVGSNLYIDYSQLQLGVDYYIWGAQLNEGTIKPYQKTETRLNIPRLDYSNGTCPSLLVEPQRTNLLTYSSSFDNAAWGKDTSVTITANYATAPDGTTTAERMQKSTTSGLEGITQNLFGLASGNYTLTFYVKSNTGSNQNAFLLYRNLQTTAITITSEWQRVSISFSAATSVDYNGILAANSLDILIWGAQLEAGSYATSYIPTTSASVTRNADVISKTGISSLIGQTEGTLFVDYNYDAHPDDNGNIPMVIYQGTNEAYIFITGSGTLKAEIYVGGSVQASITGNIGAVGRKKLAFSYKQNDFVLYMNGVQIGTDTSGTVGTMSSINVGSYYTAAYNANGGINSAALWKTRLTNTQLAQLTTI